MVGRYDNPIPTRCLAPIDFLKIPARGGFFHNFDFETVLPLSKTTAGRNFPVVKVGPPVHNYEHEAGSYGDGFT